MPSKERCEFEQNCQTCCVMRAVGKCPRMQGKDIFSKFGKKRVCVKLAGQ